MVKRLTGLRRFFPLLVGVLLVSGCVLYYLAFQRAQQSFLTDRAFRYLGVIADELAGRLNFFGQAVNRADSQHFSEYITTLVRDLDTDCSHAPTEPKKKDPASQTQTIPKLIIERGPPSRFYFRTRNSCAEGDASAVIGDILRGIPEDVFEDVLVTATDGSVLFSNSGRTVHVENVRALIAAEEANRAGTQNSKSEPDTLKSTGLPKPDTSAELIYGRVTNFTHLATVHIAGAEYKLFLQPVPTSLRTDAQQRDESARARLVLAGLIKAERFQQQSFAVPAGSAVWWIGALILIWTLPWPLLQIYSTKADGRFRLNSIPFLGLTTLVGTGVITLLTLHWLYGRTYAETETDRALSYLSSSINAHFNNELGRALTTMRSISDSEEFQTGLRSVSLARISTKPRRKGAKGPPACSSESPPPIPSNSTRSDLLTNSHLPYPWYPYFDQVFWIDRDGYQRMKWTIRGIPTPPTAVCAFPIFQDLEEDRLWTLETDSPRTFRFLVDPLYSPNTGEYLAVIYARVDELIREDVGEERMQKTVAKVTHAALVTPLVSLINPILPNDFGFALVDDSGKVLFHSTAGKNGRENFLRECGDNRELRAALLSRTGASLNLEYLGVRHRAIISPLTHIRYSPWSLIVFRPSSVDTAKYVETVLFTSIVFGLVLMCICAGCLGIIYSRRNPRTNNWLWPRAEMRIGYWQLASILSLIAALSLLWAFAFEYDMGLYGGILLPLLAAILIVAKLQSRQLLVLMCSYALLALSVLPWWVYRGDPIEHLSFWTAPAVVAIAALTIVAATDFYEAHLRRAIYYMESRSKDVVHAKGVTTLGGYMAGIALGAVILSLLPILSAYKLSYNYVSKIFLKRDQMAIAMQLDNREARLLHYYNDVKFPDQITRKAFIEDRMTGYSQDLYYAEEPESESKENTSRHDAFSRSIFDRLTGIFPYREAAEAHRLILDISEDGRWQWCTTGENRLQLIRHAESVSPNELPDNRNCKPRSSGGMPMLEQRRKRYRDGGIFSVTSLILTMSSGGGLWLAMAGVGLAIVVIGGWAVWSLFAEHTRLALSENDAPEHLPASFVSNSLLIVPPDYRAASMIAGAFVIDLTAPNCGPFYAGSIRRSSALLLDRFECVVFDPAANDKRFELLEWVLRQNITVIVASAMDPFAWSGAGENEIATEAGSSFTGGKDKWLRLFATFDVHYEPVRLTDRQERYFRLLWSTFSDEERWMLYRIARDQWVNPERGDLLHSLTKRGFVAENPALQLVDEKFRRFVNAAPTEAEVKAWNKDADANVGWNRVIYVTSFAVFGILLYAGRDVMQTTAGLIAALIAPASAIIKFLAEVGSNKSRAERPIR